MKARPKPKTMLARIWIAFRPTLPVWVALEAIARSKGRRRFYVKRSTLAHLTGITRRPTISYALGVLERYGMIQRRSKVRRKPDGKMFRRIHIVLKHRASTSVSYEHANVPSCQDPTGVPCKSAIVTICGNQDGTLTPEVGTPAVSTEEDTTTVSIPLGIGANPRAPIPSGNATACRRLLAAGQTPATASAEAPASAVLPGSIGKQQRPDSSNEKSQPCAE